MFCERGVNVELLVWLPVAGLLAPGKFGAGIGVPGFETLGWFKPDELRGFGKLGEEVGEVDVEPDAVGKAI